MKKNGLKTRKTSAQKAAKILRNFSDIFVGVTCCGNWYEPKMPDKLKK